jgi:uncharacterized protein YwgA
MNRYQLAKLVQWAGCLRARKRLQKVVYMLQSAGCPLDAEFTLHYYGPYSQDVAGLSDEMVRIKLLDETEEENMVGQGYSYKLPENTERQIAEFENSAEGRTWTEQLSGYEKLAKKLLKEDLRRLEYASTIVYFRSQGVDWPTAVEKARQFKKTDAVRNAEPLAREVLPH